MARTIECGLDEKLAGLPPRGREPPDARSLPNLQGRQRLCHTAMSMRNSLCNTGGFLNLSFMYNLDFFTNFST